MRNNVMNGAEVIANNKGTVYLRLPLEAQGELMDCGCEACKKTGGKGRWDTLVVPQKGFAWTCHMPDETAASFQAYCDSGKTVRL